MSVLCQKRANVLITDDVLKENDFYPPNDNHGKRRYIPIEKIKVYGMPKMSEDDLIICGCEIESVKEALGGKT